MRRPNLFLVGAPKCATSTLHAYLAQHPECFMSPVKEPAYFSRAHAREHVRRTVPHLQSEEAYLRLFADATAAHKIVGESTTCYMRAEADLEELKQFAGEPRIIASVRDPVSLVSSYFHYLRFQGWEPLATLREAWDIQDERCMGHIESVAANRPDSLAYRNVALLGQQVERLFRMFGRENVLVLVLDDIRDDTINVCRTLQAFLGLTYDERIEMPFNNAARASKVELLDSLVKPRSATVQKWKNRMKELTGRQSFGIRRLVQRINTRPIKHSVDPSLLSEMRAYFSDDVALLSRLLDRDLFQQWNWNDVPPVPARTSEQP